MSDIRTIDRNAEVSALAANYPPHMKEYAEHRSGHKAHVLEDKLVLECTIPARDMLRLWKKNLDSDAGAAMAKETMHHDVPNCFRKEAFSGIAPELYVKEFSGEGGMLRKRLQSAMAELSGSGLKESLEEQAVGSRKRRKRVYSDCEGQYEYDRRFDDQPFSRMINHKKDFPCIELIYPVGMNSGASAEEIGMFAARCLALADVLDGAGYRVAITAESWSAYVVEGREACKRIAGKSVSQYSLIRYPVREANEYGDIASYVPVACGEYHRKACFTGFQGQAHFVHGLKEHLGKSAHYGFGSSQSERPIPAGLGQLVLDQSTIAALFSMNKATREKMFQDRVRYTMLGRAPEQAS